MLVNLVHIRVKEEYLEAFMEASVENHRNTIREPGNLRFDILQDAQDPFKWIFYEVFRDQDAVAAHKATQHYIKWRDMVADWMAEPRKGITHRAIAPVDERQWQTPSI